MKAKQTYLLSVFTLYLLLCGSAVFAQEKESTDIHKTKSSATIGGVKYYLHTVEKGQTLFAIAKFYKIEVNDLVIENPEAIDGIKPGQVLRIPTEKKVVIKQEPSIDTSNCFIHIVEKGQTLYSITKQYGVSDEVLKKLNPELLNGLKTGQKIMIPSNKPKSNLVESIPVSNKEVIVDKTKEKRLVQATEIQKVDVAERVITAGSQKYNGELKDEYHIAFFLPFHADESNGIEMEKLIKGEERFSNKTAVALDFFEGAKLAIDSLKKEKLNAKVFVYDVDDKDSLGVLNLLKKPELASMDLIIGPLYGSSFMPVAKFAKENEIPIVSPFTQVNKILFENPFVCKVSPSATLQVERMATYVVDSFQTQNIILVNGGGLAKDVPFYNSFKKAANDYIMNLSGTKKDTIKEAKGLSGLQLMLSTTQINVVVLPSSNQSFVTDFISKLYGLRDKYKIVLFGLQTWINYDNLDFEYLNTVSLHTPSNTFIDYHNPKVRTFIKNYRESYKTEPSQYAFQGFDVTYFFVNALKQNGTGFLNNLGQLKYNGLDANFEFSQFPVESGFENKYVFMQKYQDYKLVKANQ